MINLSLNSQVVFSLLGFTMLHHGVVLNLKCQWYIGQIKMIECNQCMAVLDIGLAFKLRGQ